MTEQQMALLESLAGDNPVSYNFDKALEEAAEFSEALLKFKTKKPERRPNRMQILEEYSDFMYRGFIAIQTLFPDKTQEEILTMCQSHINKKLAALTKYKKQGQYKGGL